MAADPKKKNQFEPRVRNGVLDQFLLMPPSSLSSLNKLSQTLQANGFLAEALDASFAKSLPVHAQDQLCLCLANVLAQHDRQASLIADVHARLVVLEAELQRSKTAVQASEEKLEARNRQTVLAQTRLK